MVIPVNEKYRIASDRNSWMVQEGRLVKGEQRWDGVGWYGDLDGAVRGLAQLMVREIPDHWGVKLVLNRMGEIEAELTGSLTPYLEWCKNPVSGVAKADEVTRQ